jgi:thiol-disulfide isomerase/thioredoxin
MTDASPPDAPGSPAPPAQPAVRKPRKRFILIGFGIGVLIIVLIGIFTNLGTSQSTTDAPQPNGPVPSFTASNIGPTGPARLSVSPGATSAPTVLLFFGAWCPSCHQELPQLTAVVRRQAAAGGSLSHVRVIGVDSEDTAANAKSFIEAAGVTFPVAYDPNLSITEGAFFFDGDPDTVFIRPDGAIAKIVRGDTLDDASFTADERQLIPNGT